MHVGVEEAGADRLGEERQHQPAGERGQVVPRGLERFDVGDLDAVDPFDRHHPPIGAVPVDRGDAIAFETAHRLGELGGRGCLAAQVELAIGPALEVGDRQPRAQPRCLAAERFEMGSGPFVGRDVARQPLADAGTQHLDRDMLALGGDRAVDLRDRGRTDRNRVDLGVDRVDRRFEAARDLGANRFERHRRQVVLQRQQVARRFFADEVGPRGQRLAELDRGGADLLKRRGIVRRARLHRSEARDAGQPLDRLWGVGIALDPAQRAVLRQRAAPRQEPPDMRRGSGHPRLSTRNELRPARP